MKNLKKLFITAFAALCIGQNAFAVPAYPRPITVRQADGTTLTILLRGDEHGHLTLTEDGYPLYYNVSSGNYEYATMVSGVISGSGIIAKDNGSRSDEAIAFLQSQDKEAIISSVKTLREGNIKKAQSINKVKTTNYPSTGEQHPLVILVQFSDRSFSSVDDPNTFFTNMLNQEGFTYSNGANGSVRDFYVASSNGNYLPTFDVAGPVTVSQSYSYYGANNSYTTDYNVGYMIREACEALDSQLDFSQYDNDGDGYVDNIYNICW
ncbi:MAG: hypothetical protein Q4D41_09085 [Prevotellaceae bacterium]|nr:hypothetical protein [Prevotellaceae bacterium]